MIPVCLLADQITGLQAGLYRLYIDSAPAAMLSACHSADPIGEIASDARKIGEHQEQKMEFTAPYVLDPMLHLISLDSGGAQCFRHGRLTMRQGDLVFHISYDEGGQGWAISDADIFLLTSDFLAVLGTPIPDVKSLIRAASAAELDAQVRSEQAEFAGDECISHP